MKKLREGHNLETKFAATRRVFQNFVAHTHLNKVLGAFSDWAVVGGAVRDVLLADKAGCSDAEHLWQDLDIAVAHKSKKSLLDAFMHVSTHWRVQSNSFGGVKANHPTIGSIDLWVTGKFAPRNNRQRYRYWEHYLDGVDFGVNAVAFAWPISNVIVHRRWLEDSQSNCVEVLSDHSPRRELQPLRAIALGAALTCRFSRQALLGEGVWGQIDDLLDTPEEIPQAVDYLRDKIASGRWKSDSLIPFIAHLIDHPFHTSTERELQFLNRLRSVIELEAISSSSM